MIVRCGLVFEGGYVQPHNLLDVLCCKWPLALSSRTDHINTPFKKSIKSSLQVFLEVVPVTLNEPLKLSKKLFN
jgi:hypothetical protein